MNELPASTHRENALVPMENITATIALVRGQRVILDSDLARLYGVQTFRLNEAVKRNRDRFPPDFLFQLTAAEHNSLTSQFAMSKRGRGGRRTLPYAFTKHGALMAATILNSPRAVAMSIYVIRAFVQFRQSLATHADLARKLAALEKQYDAQFRVVFEAIRQLVAPPATPRREIGFHTAKQ